ncbi:MAG: hypothetical protein KDD44_11260, partial [Bdellovibrionales bacterium]|nr:hypothetical protein [Bdellovibrionales bacterium]
EFEGDEGVESLPETSSGQWIFGPYGGDDAPYTVGRAQAICSALAAVGPDGKYVEGAAVIYYSENPCRWIVDVVRATYSFRPEWQRERSRPVLYSDGTCDFYQSLEIWTWEFSCEHPLADFLDDFSGYELPGGDPDGDNDPHPSTGGHTGGLSITNEQSGFALCVKEFETECGPVSVHITILGNERDQYPHLSDGITLTGPGVECLNEEQRQDLIAQALQECR